MTMLQPHAEKLAESRVAAWVSGNRVMPWWKGACWPFSKLATVPFPESQAKGVLHWVLGTYIRSKSHKDRDSRIENDFHAVQYF